MTRCPACSADIDDTSRFCPSCGASRTRLADTTPLGASTRADAPDAAPRPHAHETRFLPGALLANRYRIVALLGRGGMGEVFRADDVKLGQTVALKLLPPALAQDPANLERLFAEVRVGRQVSHPNCCRLYDVVEIDGHHCVSMEFVDGEDLASLLKRIGRLPVDKAVQLAREIAAGLAAAHDKGVIHRDLKPANVMIDGKGRARITDFGLAAFAEDIDDTFAGTPAYMAPEQIIGGPATVASDVYAFGLTFYEMLTGQRRYDARTLSELKQLHDASGPPSLTSSVGDVPHDVERLVQRCLAKDPNERPASLQAVIAALPGGDPLQAALAAGETPSPEMVAAAGQSGVLPVGAAWACLLVALAMLGLLAHLASRTTAIGLLQPEFPPEVLAAKAREILASFGHGVATVDRAQLFTFDAARLGALRGVPAERLRDERPGLLRFVHRESPRPLVARRAALVFMFPGEVGRVNEADPPLDVSGMTYVELDERGRLVEFVAVPSPPTAEPPRAPTDWAAALAACGIDTASLRPAPPRERAPVATDETRAWRATYPGQTVPVHIEAATAGGAIVWIAVRDERGPKDADADPLAPMLSNPMASVTVLFTWFLAGALIVMARRNLLLGRGDRRGALRIAVAVFVSLALALALRADHTAQPLLEYSLVFNIVAQALTFAALTWLLYIAFEPAARRSWPVAMIAWSRLLAGKWRDPLVGRDLLIGTTAGIVMTLLVHVEIALGLDTPVTRSTPLNQIMSPLASAKHVAFFVLLYVYFAVGAALGALSSLWILRAILRVEWVAWLLVVPLIYLLLGIVGLTGASVAVAIGVIGWFVLLRRVGVWAAMAAFYAVLLLAATPLTLDPDAWYWDRALLACAVIAVLLAWGFLTALGGQPAFGHSFDEPRAR